MVIWFHFATTFGVDSYSRHLEQLLNHKMVRKITIGISTTYMYLHFG